MGGQLVAAQDEAHLWAVPVRDHHIPPLFYHVRDVAARFLNRLPLVFHLGVLLILDE